MSKSWSWKITSSGVIVAICLALTLAFTALGQPAPYGAQEAASPADSSYVGTRRCVECHAEQAQTWSKTKHVNTFTCLPAQYRADPACMTCHVTGYGEPGGYVQGTPAETLEDLLEVGCEACHGPGSAHEKASRELVGLDLTTMSDQQLAQMEQRIRGTIHKNHPQNVCIRCHFESDRRHPPFNRDSTQSYGGSSTVTDWPIVTGPSPVWHEEAAPEPPPPSGQLYTGKKACGACHFPQYKLWSRSPHAVAAAVLPPKYQSDEQCLKCHVTGQGEPGGYTAGTHPSIRKDLLGVTCESCHGPGSEHVRLAKHFARSLQIGPQWEQAARASIYKVRPGNVCMQCHWRHGHKPHPEFDRAQPPASRYPALSER